MEQKVELAKNSIFLVEKLFKETLLLNRILYKIKNQFRRQKHYKFLIQLKKYLYKHLLTDFRSSYEISLKDSMKINYNLIRLQRILRFDKYNINIKTS